MKEQGGHVDLIFFAMTAIFFILIAPARRRTWLRAVLPVIPVLAVGSVALLGQWDDLKSLVDVLACPERLFALVAMVLALGLLYYRSWTRPLPALLLLIGSVVLYAAAALDDHFAGVLSEPDHIPITLIFFGTGFAFWIALRRAATHDALVEAGKEIPESDPDDRVTTWPHLIGLELVAMVGCTAILIFWSILVRAPLEPPADPYTAPNPAKAPWYFLGLQELLVYFDPWIAGVLIPVLIVVGLCALPYLDRQPGGSGFYTLKGRRFAVSVFVGGFLLLWILPIVIGTFLRGPNWSFFGPFEQWDALRMDHSANINLSDVFWCGLLQGSVPTQASHGSGYLWLRELPGFLLLGVYFLAVPTVCGVTLFKSRYARMGFSRYAVMMFLLLMMILIPVKMLLRWTFDLKYILAIPEWSLNI